MTKEFTGPEFEIEFARAWLAYLEAGKVGTDPRGNWEYTNVNQNWQDLAGMPLCNAGGYRWKPAPKRTITIGYESHDGAERISKTLVAPEVEAPWPERLCYVLAEANSVSRYSWANSGSEQRLLNAGCVFLNREDAQAMSDWLAVCRKGGQS